MKRSHEFKQVAIGIGVCAGLLGSAALLDSCKHPSADTQQDAHINPENSGADILLTQEPVTEDLSEVFAGFTGALATDRTACPKGGTALPRDIRVYVSNTGTSDYDAYVEIDDAIRYEDKNGKVIGWCGESVGPDEQLSIAGPALGTITLMAACEYGKDCFRPVEYHPTGYDIPLSIFEQFPEPLKPGAELYEY